MITAGAFTIDLWFVIPKRKEFPSHPFSGSRVTSILVSSHSSYTSFSPTDIFVCQSQCQGTPATRVLRDRHIDVSNLFNEMKGSSPVYVIQFGASSLSCKKFSYTLDCERSMVN